MRRAIHAVACGWPTMRRSSVLSSSSRLSISSFNMRPTGMPVQSWTTAAIACRSTQATARGCSPWHATSSASSRRQLGQRPVCRVCSDGASCAACGRPEGSPGARPAVSPAAWRARRGGARSRPPALFPFPSGEVSSATRVCSSTASSAAIPAARVPSPSPMAASRSSKASSARSVLDAGAAAVQRPGRAHAG